MEDIWLWQGFTLIGFLIGAALAYYLRGGTIKLVQSISLEMLSEFNFFKDKPPEI